MVIDKTALASGLSDWPRRLEEELPLLEAVLATAPSRRIVDLGCGEGRHARALAELGYEVVGLDASESALDRAQEEPIPEGVQFILADLGAVERSVHGHFGAALCLGNTLPSLLSPESVTRMLIGLRRRLQPGASLVIHCLNYDRVFSQSIRDLPTTILPAPDGEVVLFELMTPRPDSIVLHTSVAASYAPNAEAPVEILETYQSQLRGWRRDEIETMLEVARFSIRETWGDMRKTLHTTDSTELVVVAQ